MNLYSSMQLIYNSHLPATIFWCSLTCVCTNVLLCSCNFIFPCNAGVYYIPKCNFVVRPCICMCVHVHANMPGAQEHMKLLIAHSIYQRCIVVIRPACNIRLHQCTMYMMFILYILYMVHLVYIKPGGEPDKLCVFPADQS